MIAALSLFALACGQTPDRSEWLLSPQYVPGLELTYGGTYQERSLIPGVEHRREYRLKNMILVTEAKPRQWEIALLTSMSLRNPRDAAEAPTSIRLERGEVDRQGGLRGANAHLLIAPIDGPPTLEAGSFIPFPLVRVGRHQEWTVTEPGRPPRTWHVLGLEPRNGVNCIKLIGRQQSDDWALPRADRIGWRRTDTVWIMPQLGIPARVERAIETRDRARQVPTQVTETAYDLEDYRVCNGKLFEDRQFEILWARKFLEKARPLWQKPATYKPQLDQLAHEINYHLGQYAETPYRKALLQVQRNVARARGGEPVENRENEMPELVPSVRIGHRAPDFVAAELTGSRSAQLHRLLGRPVLMFFYNPSTPTGAQVLRFAGVLADRQRDKITVLALAVTKDVDIVRKQHKEMLLPFSIYDGDGMHLTFEVDATPRFLILDAEGVVRETLTGWAGHVPREIEESLHALTQRERQD